MANFRLYGLSEYSKALSQLEIWSREQVIGRAVYEGAGIVADEVRRELKNLPVDGGTGSVDKPLIGINKEQRHFLKESMGISHMKESDGYYHVSIGFAGYNETKTAKWPKGQPNAVIAASAERGTSFLHPNPFMKRAVNGCRDKVVKVMGKTIDDEIRKIMDKK